MGEELKLKEMVRTIWSWTDVKDHEKLEIFIQTLTNDETLRADIQAACNSASLDDPSEDRCYTSLQNVLDKSPLEGRDLVAAWINAVSDQTIGVPTDSSA